MDGYIGMERSGIFLQNKKENQQLLVSTQFEQLAEVEQGSPLATVLMYIVVFRQTDIDAHLDSGRRFAVARALVYCT